MREYVKFATANQLRTIDKLSREMGLKLPYVSMMTSCREASIMITKLEVQQKNNTQEVAA